MKPYTSGTLAPVVVAALALASLSPAAPALAASCVQAGSTSMTTVVNATSGQHITGSISASGCDLGVYVGPGIRGVSISNASITGAKRHAILVQNTNGVSITHNTITGNEPLGETSHESKPIQLEGTRGVIVSENTINHNGGGGISVLDDGPATPDGIASAVVPSENNIISNNSIADNTGGCAIVVAAYNHNGGIRSNKVVGNLVERNIAGIVIATDVPDSTASGNDVVNNTSNDNGEAGVVVHSNAGGDVVSDTHVINNSLTGNEPVGILVAAGAASAELTNTSLIANRICGSSIAISRAGDSNTREEANKIC